jgi:tripartite-type tricarboxylate transporter receptor subunit TctC
MNYFSRRRFLHLAAGAVALSTASPAAWPQTYPNRPVRILVGYPAGGVTDTVARVIGQWLSDHLGRPFLVENRSGAATNIATEAVAHAQADGYTLLLCTGTNTINDSLYQKLNFNFQRDIQPIATIVNSPLVMEVHPSFPATTVPEFIAYAKSSPAKITMASAGTGTQTHVAGELFKVMAGVDMNHIPYRGDSPAIADLLGGQVQVYFSTLPASIDILKAGKLRPLAVTTTARLEVLPEVPTVSEFLPGFEVSVWQGLCGPKETPPAIVKRLSDEIGAGLADSDIRQRFAELGLTILSGTTGEFKRLISEETEKWSKVIQVANIPKVE